MSHAHRFGVSAGGMAEIQAIMELARLLLLLVVLSHPSSPMILLNPIYRSTVSAYPRRIQNSVANQKFSPNKLNRAFRKRRAIGLESPNAKPPGEFVPRS